MRRTLVLFAVLTLVLFGSAAPVGADSGSRPFTGSTTGVATWALDADCLNMNPWALRTDSAATGNANHLGRLVMTSQHCTPTGSEITGGEMVFVAADGDEVHLEYSGTTPTVDELIPGETFTVDLEFAIVGGTGRFENADGAGQMTGFVLFESLDAMEVAASWVWNGTIGY